jgi:hypothetical protein
MKRRSSAAYCLTLSCVLLIGACASPSEETSKASPAPVSPDQPLPAGHPAVGAPGARPIEPPPGSGTGAAALAWADPEGWQAVTPSSAMRRAQYRVPGAAGDAEFVAFYFGPGEGGDAQSNVVRWANQFSQADGSSSVDKLVTETMDVGDVSVLLAEVTGIYSGGMAGIGGPEQTLPDYMLLGAIAEGPDANWFFKFTGPESTVRENKAKFMAVIESLRPAGQ